ncbi:hypothetical protein [Rossellomorea sp. LJF3]|uniref:hypothetical protein n=1 Tax=Rossellomorea sp. LJF3 TaxID=3126099 RepID=UPI00300C7C4E
MKRYSWISYLSVGIPMVLLGLLFVVSTIPNESVVKTIFYSLYIGAPLSIVLSVIALWKRNERNALASVGLISAVLLTGSIFYVLMLGFGMGEA